MAMGYRILFSALMGLCLITGCSSGKGPKLAAADGTVTFMGAPLAGASVIFIPDKGPVAMGITDTSGKFVLSTGPDRGALVGPGKFTVTASTGGIDSKDAEAVSKQPKTPAETEAYMKKAAEMQKAMASGQIALPKSLLPIKYAKAETSDLVHTIKENGDNHFAIDLKP